jgi:hypothetical protein
VAYQKQAARGEQLNAAWKQLGDLSDELPRASPVIAFTHHNKNQDYLFDEYHRYAKDFPYYFTDRFDAAEKTVQRILSDAANEALPRYYSEAEMAPLHDVTAILEELAHGFAAQRAYYDMVQDDVAYRTQSKFHDKGEWFPPGVEDVETLWHVSTNAPSVEQHGFKTRDELAQIGIDWAGIGGAVNGISFTGSYEWAVAIYDFFVGLMDLFTGPRTLDDVREFLPDVPDEYWEGAIEEILGDEVPARLSTKQTYEFIRRLGASSHLAGGRFVIALMGYWAGNKLIPFLESGNADRIGIIEAKVDMTNPDVTYYRGEEEFRVPVEAILKYRSV